MENIALKVEETQSILQDNEEVQNPIADLVKEAWQRTAPFWPLKNLIAVNPLQGLEDLPIEEALKTGAAYFQQADLPESMQQVNRETIKWLQAYFDEGQATITMPLRKRGLYVAWKQLAVYDSKLHAGDKQKKQWLQRLPETAEQAIAESLLQLSISKEERGLFLELMLSTLSGWASYVKYRTDWAGENENNAPSITQADYLAVRLAVTTLLWPEAKQLLQRHQKALKLAEQQESPLAKLEENEKAYRDSLLTQLTQQTMSAPYVPDAQLVFCIDVRSEPYRRALEATGDYQTLGFAGFFGVPMQVTDEITGESYMSCPVLLSPQHEVKEAPCSHEAHEHARKGQENIGRLKHLYQSLKYSFATPFALVEGLGIANGFWMGMRSLFPAQAFKAKAAVAEKIAPEFERVSSLEDISFEQQCAYAEGALRMMGLTNHFAPLVVFCGHGSSTQNNAYATALDCGACAGRHGGSNARVLAEMLNDKNVRQVLMKNGIEIPATTRFVAAQHNTTTDEVTLFGDQDSEKIRDLQRDLEEARQANSAYRLSQMHAANGATQPAEKRSQDWAQVRPEWGLARNAAFIIGPRELTNDIDLEGRSFLHSYDYRQDKEGSSLTTILTAPMVVAEWINTQYLFSTLDNVAYGGGSKVTKNITGKIGVMQGNASDLMTGLPLQSVYASDEESYHEPQRLMGVVYAPREIIDKIISEQEVLQKLLGNGWVQLAAIEPEGQQAYLLNRDLGWEVAI